MHIHYNTNQTTLPLEIGSFFPQDHLVFTIEKVVNTLEDCHFHAFYHAFARPSYHPKMLIATLLFAYSQGIFSGRKIEKMMIENLAMQYLTGPLVISYRTINRFRVAEGMEEGQTLKQICQKLVISCELITSFWHICLSVCPSSIPSATRKRLMVR